MKALTYLADSDEGRFLINEIYNRELQVQFNDQMKAGFNITDQVLHWDPKRGLTIVDKDGNPGAISPALVLAHELYHWFYNMPGDGVLEEELATAYEGRIARDLGEPIRPQYNSFYDRNPDPRVYDSTASGTKEGGWRAVKNGQIEAGPEYDPDVKLITNSKWEKDDPENPQSIDSYRRNRDREL